MPWIPSYITVQKEGRRLTFEYTPEDFQGPEPYEMILAIENPFERESAIEALARYAFSKKVSFKKLFKAYCDSLKREKNTVYIDSVTQFTGQDLNLDCGSWSANDWGISRRTGYGDEVACCHPIMPVERIVNIDTGIEKLKIAFSKGKKWREIIVDKETLASANKIVSLSNTGIAVTSENAKALVRYISDIENINYDIIPERKSVGRLGHIEGEGFSPYVEGLIFDGNNDYKDLFNTVRKHGSSNQWKAIASECRRMSVTARIMLASSFASVLVEPLGLLPFFVHLWGGTETGKTVSLLLAASVWADPERGRYTQTFNSTGVGAERTAAFLNSMPLIMDELQLAMDSRGRSKFNVYELAQGVGRTRGNKSGGVDKTPTWSNCILTTGESPLTSLGDGAGAINRVIDIECTDGERVITDGIRVSGILKKNYGFAGKLFLDQLSKDGVMDYVEKRHREVFKILSEGDTTEKQSTAAAVIVVADELISKWFFGGEKPLTVPEMATFLQTKTSVSSGERGYQYVCEWVAQNSIKFRSAESGYSGEVYGDIRDGWAYIIPKVFKEACGEGGFSPAALLSFMRERKLIRTSTRGGKNRNTVGHRVGDFNTDCYAVRLPGDGEEHDDFIDI